METNIFVYVSVVEGVMIVFMLGWEIFWLSRMYKVLWNMPTAKQIGEMVDMIKSDRDSIRQSLTSLVGAFDPLRNMFGSIGSLGGLLSGNKQEIGK